MIRCGDSTIHFTKVKSTQLADIMTVMKKRPKDKFSTGLSLEAKEVLQQLEEETKIEQNARRGKRGSKGNVLFSDTVQIRRGSTTSQLGFYDMFKDTSASASAVASPRTPRTSRVEGKDSVRPSVSVKVKTDRPGSLSLAVDQVMMANRPSRYRKSSRIQEDKREDLEDIGRRSRRASIVKDKTVSL